MGRFLHLAWDEGGDDALRRTLIASARAHGFAEALDEPGAWLGISGPRPPALSFPGGPDFLVLGDLFPHPDGPRGRMAQQGADRERGRDLTRRYWGRYVGLLRTPRGQVRQMLRDPSGAYEAIAWRRDGVQIVTSVLPDWLLAIAGPKLSLDWNRIGGMLADPVTVTAEAALTGIRVAQAGDLTDLTTSDTTPLWRPAQFVASGPDNPSTAAASLRVRIDDCLARFASVLPTCGVEISGGLDSAIVAGALKAGGGTPGLWLNFFGPLGEADERPYAQDLAQAFGVQPSFVERVITPMTGEGFWSTAGGPRPGLNGRDFAFDHAVALATRESGVEALITGKGGDGVLFQMGVVDIFSDLLKERGLQAFVGPALPNLARWTRRSVWSVARAGLEGARPRPLDRAERALSIFNPDSVVRTGGETALHPWLRGLEAFGPAKRLQIESVAAGLAYQTGCRRTEAVDLIHPLLAQPVVEYCLGLSIALMTGDGQGDRQLARTAFADRLPPRILRRRSKGEMTAYFGRQAAMSLPFLRDHLLGGRLAEMGLIDKGRTEALLDSDRMMWKGGAPDFTMASVVESWVRRWEARGAGS